MAIRRTWAALLAAAISGMNGHAQVPSHQGLTFNDDGALRNNQIHWPKGFEPEQADLFAQNEIDIQAGCEIVKTSTLIPPSFFPKPPRGATSSQKRLWRALVPFSSVSSNRTPCTRVI